MLIKGKIKHESNHPVSKFLIKLYKPFVYVALRNPKTTIAIGLAAIIASIPMVPKIGSEFMPPLNEGDILYMPTTFPNISVEQAKQYMQYQDRVIKSFPGGYLGLRQGRPRRDRHRSRAAFDARDGGPA